MNRTEAIKEVVTCWLCAYGAGYYESAEEIHDMMSALAIEKEEYEEYLPPT